MRAFLCSILGHRFSWIVEQRTGVVTAVCRRCKRPILCPFPQAEPETVAHPHAGR